MKIVHIQYRMPPAGNACFRLHSAMRTYGIESTVLTIIPSVRRSNVYCVKQGLKSFIIKIYNYVSENYKKRILRPNSYFYSGLPLFSPSLHKEKIVQEADVVYFHWIAGGCLRLSEVEKIASTGKPVIFFMHDMWDFTGGCHHCFDCKEYESGCKECHMFKRKNKFSAMQIDIKKKIFSKYPNIVFISPSKWMANCARKSYALQNSKVFDISNVVDETNFKPINKYISKQILNIPTDKKIITFGCQAGTNNRFKGWEYLQKAMSLLNRSDIHILIYGSDFDIKTQEQIKHPITFLGPIFDETKLALICNATDVFVSPSLAESFGLTFLENILCDTPVVGFDNTAIREIVKTGITGYLAKNKDYRDLANGINMLLDSDLHVNGGISYSSKKCIDEHMHIIKHLQTCDSYEKF